MEANDDLVLLFQLAIQEGDALFTGLDLLVGLRRRPDRAEFEFFWRHAYQIARSGRYQPEKRN